MLDNCQWYVGSKDMERERGRERERERVGEGGDHMR
jgi:hypothetical protein